MCAYLLFVLPKVSFVRNYGIPLRGWLYFRQYEVGYLWWLNDINRDHHAVAFAELVPAFVFHEYF
jgi:hypothetical protein